MKKLQTSIWPTLSQNSGIWTVVYSVIGNKALQYVSSIYSSKKLRRKLQKPLVSAKGATKAAWAYTAHDHNFTICS